jgi:hypothetical protein
VHWLNSPVVGYKTAEVKNKHTKTEQGILKHLDDYLFIYLWFMLQHLKLKL